MGHALRLDGPLPHVVSTQDELLAAASDLASGEGPFGVDAERAGSYRYSQRAYLIQVYRRHAPVLLLDPVPIDDFSPLKDVLSQQTWVMQAAHNDLECLAEVDLVPPSMFDTEIAGQLLGLEKVGLAALVESQLGYTLRKSHGQADWSRRPLKSSWLEYAVFDVLLLPDLEDALQEKLDAAGKSQWAVEEFTHQIRQRVKPDPDARWRRTGGAGRLRKPAQRGALRALWYYRDELARGRDVAWHRIVRDQVLVEMAKTLPASEQALAAVKDVPAGVLDHSAQWLRVIEQGAAQPIAALERPDGPPARSLRTWEQRDPEAAKRWVAARETITGLAEELCVWPQTLLAADIVADIAWSPPEDLAARMSELGARPWQIQHTVDAFRGVLH